MPMKKSPKMKLYLKVFSGPKIGLLTCKNSVLRSNVLDTVEDLSALLALTDLSSQRDKLTVKVRTSSDRIMDGLFIADGVYGFFCYAPSDVAKETIEAVLAHGLNMVELYLSVSRNDRNRFLTSGILPGHDMPEFSSGIGNVYLWTETNGLSVQSSSHDRPRSVYADPGLN
jgi:hypothetical protein